MTKEQYDLLFQYALDFNSAVCAYEDEHGPIDLTEDPISEIVVAGAHLMHLVNTLEPIYTPIEEDPF